MFHDLSEIFARTADELLPPPVFPTFDLSIPVGQLPPSLPFTDPVIPDMHPTPYLFSLHRLSLQRANQLLAIRLFHGHQLAVARKLYDAEVERIEEEYEGATKGVVERLLEGVEERRRRLTEEKEGEGVTLGTLDFFSQQRKTQTDSSSSTDTFLDPQSRSHGTRRRGGPSRMHSSRPHVAGTVSPSSDALLPPPNGVLANGGSSAADSLSTSHNSSSLLSFNGIPDPFNLASTFLPSHPTSHNHPLLSSLTSQSNSGTPLGGPLGGKRKPGPRAQPGLPPAHYVVTSGSYQQFGKSLAGLSALRGDEIEGDLGEVRRKRPRGRR